MENQDRPNLFQYATSELSQDAFICWLAAWADPIFKAADADLHEIGQQFVISMICKQKADYHQSTLKTVKVRRQVGKLDVLIEVNKELPNQLAILVEDKTHTSNHSDQLNRYYGQVKELGYTENQMIPLYFKTGYQSRFDTLGVFKPYLRKDFLSVLRENKRKTDNAVFHDFLDHLESLESAIQQFSAKALDQWYGNDWPGFYMVLYDEIGSDGANWSYVANPSGGFFGFWWYFKEVPGKQYMPYLQLEQDKLCFKIMVEGESSRRNAREDAYESVQRTASQLSVNIERPERMGNGKFMTVARRKEDYRVMTNGKLDLAATLENLKKAQQLLDTAFP
jgi:hypothetical protein